jgi:predicted nucleic acid-binding Zn ribbon protein
VQAGWGSAAGAEFAARCRPIAERDGTIVVVCESAVWAQELEFRGPEVVERLRAEGGLDSVRGLAVRVGDLNSAA